MTRRFIGYPAGWTLSVIGDAAAADAAVAELQTAGIGAYDVIVLAGTNCADQIARLGTSTGLAARIRRGVQFVTMDQMPDLHVYELAMEQGHPLLGIRVADSEKRMAAIDILRRHGAHFINRFGDWATEEIAPWRGRMPDLPQHMQR
jgi:hypothetical protein